MPSARPSLDAARVERIEVGEPSMLMSNMLHGYERFGVSFHGSA